MPQPDTTPPAPPSPAHGHSRVGLAAKLAIGFGALTLMSVALGGFALQRMSAIDKKLVVVSNDSLPAILTSSKLAVAIEDLRRNQSLLLVSDDGSPEEKEAEAEIEHDVAKVAAIRREADPLIQPGRERARFTTDFDRAWPDFRTDNTELVQLKISSQVEQSRESFFGKTRKTFDQLLAFTQWDAQFKRRPGPCRSARQPQSLHSRLVADPRRHPARDRAQHRHRRRTRPPHLRPDRPHDPRHAPPRRPRPHDRHPLASLARTKSARWPTPSRSSNRA